MRSDSTDEGAPTPPAWDESDFLPDAVAEFLERRGYRADSEGMLLGDLTREDLLRDSAIRVLARRTIPATHPEVPSTEVWAGTLSIPERIQYCFVLERYPRCADEHDISAVPAVTWLNVLFVRRDWAGFLARFSPVVKEAQAAER